MLQAELSAIVTYNPWSLDADATLGDLLGMLDCADHYHWPVADSERQLIGMLTSADLVRTLEAEAARLVPANVGCFERSEAIRNRPVVEIMSPRVLSIQTNESPATALWTMLEHQLQALPVLTDSYLTALVTASDFVREFSYGESLASCISVSESMRSPAESVECDATLDEVARAMHSASADVIPVVRGDLPLGVVSRRDVGALKLRLMLREVVVEDSAAADATSILAVAASAPTIRPGERLSSAARLMLEHDRQAIAVVNQANRLLGVVTEDMVLRAMLDAMRS